jgi:putative SOS response-associated peptidase YedK
MCGRYGRRGDKQYIAEHYAIRRHDFDEMPEEHPYAFAPNYNITPDSFQPVVRLSHETGEREFALMKWGLVPYWSKTPKAGFSSINARSENLQSSGAWRDGGSEGAASYPPNSFKNGNCLPLKRRSRI